MPQLSRLLEVQKPLKLSGCTFAVHHAADPAIDHWNYAYLDISPKQTAGGVEPVKAGLARVAVHRVADRRLQVVAQLLPHGQRCAPARVCQRAPCQLIRHRMLAVLAVASEAQAAPRVRCICIWCVSGPQQVLRSCAWHM